jgi:hypothetical protein
MNVKFKVKITSKTIDETRIANKERQQQLSGNSRPAASSNLPLLTFACLFCRSKT